MIFDNVPTAPEDAILGLTEAFQKDPNPRKINLSVGVYKDSHGKTPIMESVKEAEKRIFRDETSKNYLGIAGSPLFARAVQTGLFVFSHEAAWDSRRATTVQTPGGTAALRVAADFVKKQFPSASVWLSEPTWPNHSSIFEAAGLRVRTYPYFDPATNGVAFDRMLAALADAPAGDVLLLHGCCHNPTGIDLDIDQWMQIAQLVGERKLLPLVDFAYQGLAEGISEDAAGVSLLAATGLEMLVASSFSKNFGLYNERVGGLTTVCRSAAHAEAVLSQLKRCIRANYSNPPAHGSAIVVTILSDPILRAQWEEEVRNIRERINGMRKLFVKTLVQKGVKRDFSFITRQRGMFSYSGLTPDQVKCLREKHAIYLVGSGRINVAGMTEENMGPLCTAIADVLGH